MDKKFKKNFSEYFVTVLVTLILVFALSMIVELELMFRCEKYVNLNELNVENLSKFCTIEELEKKLLKNPEDFILNIRLALAYESLNDLEKANEHYKNALKLSGRSNYTLYSYAVFCAKNDLFVIASTLAEELSGNNKKTNFLKAKIYEQIAICLDKKQNYSASAKSYQIVYKYAKSIGNIRYINDIKDKYSQEYIKLADYNMSINEFDEAISNLKNSLKIKKSALANYKLGLIYLQKDPHVAEKYINKAFFDDAFVVNPYIYNSLLNKLLTSAKDENNGGLINYYNSRLNRFKKKLNENYLYKEQIIIDNSTLLIKKVFPNKTKNILFFELKNNTKNSIKNLFIKAEINVDGKKYYLDKKIISSPQSLDGYDVMQCQDLYLPDEINFSNVLKKDEIFIKYFAKRTQDAPWTMIKIDFLDI